MRRPPLSPAGTALSTALLAACLAAEAAPAPDRAAWYRESIVNVHFSGQTWPFERLPAK